MFLKKTGARQPVFFYTWKGESMSSFYFAVLTSLVWGCVPIIEKFGLSKLEPTIGLFYRCLGVLIGVAVLLVFNWKGIRSSWVEFPSGIFYLMLGGLLASVVGQYLFYHALKNGESSQVVPLAASYPLISFLLGVWLLGEKITWAKAGGLLFVLLGVVLLK